MSEGRIWSGWACEWKSAGICLAGLAAYDASGQPIAEASSISGSGSSISMTSLYCRASGFVIVECGLKTAGKMPTRQNSRDGCFTFPKS